MPIVVVAADVTIQANVIREVDVVEVEARRASRRNP